MHPRQLARPVDRHRLTDAEILLMMRELSFADAPVFKPTVEGLAKTMRDQFPDCSEASLQAEGYTLAFQREHGDAARTIANKGFTRELESFDDRAYRIEKAANMAAGLVTQEAIANHLLANGFRPRELGDIIVEVTIRTAEIVVGRVNAPEQVS